MNKQDWYKIIKDDNENVKELINDIFEFSQQNEYKKYFSTCGLYSVGSSLTGKYNDIDLTLVGLDFRSVFNYDKCYLRDSEKLIENELVIPKGDSYYYNEVEFTENGIEYVVNREITRDWCLNAHILLSHINVGELPISLFSYLSNKRNV